MVLLGRFSKIYLYLSIQIPGLKKFCVYSHLVSIDREKLPVGTCTMLACSCGLVGCPGKNNILLHPLHDCPAQDDKIGPS